MNIFKSLAVFSLFCVNVSNAQVGIGVPAENIHPSAELEVKSNTKGFLPPRMTKAERGAIVTPAAGLLIYQTDGDETNPTGLYFFDGTAWKNGLGVKGETGAVGPAGPKGDTGAQGIQGPAGANGTNGAQGLPGAKGDTGDQGIQGAKGDKGDVGATGSQGIKGDKGDAGVTGSQGLQGVKGDTGDQGIQGVKGEKGETGSQGIQGVKGDKGDVGATGPQGEPGLTGPQGITGSGSSIVVNNSTSSITNRLCFTNGTSGTAVNSLLTNNALTFTPGIGNLSSILFTGNLTGNVTGNATSASQVAVTSNSTSGVPRYLSFSPYTNGVSELQTNNALTYVPATGTLSATNVNATTFTGNVTGNASSASQVAVTSTSASTDRYLSFTSGSFSNSTLQISDNAQTALKYNPGTGVLTVPSITLSNGGTLVGNVSGNLTGNASNASKITLNNSVTNLNNYLSFSPYTNGVSELQTNNALTFNPATGTLSATNVNATTFTGSLIGNASSASQVAVTSTSASYAPRYLSFTGITSGNTGLQTNVALNYIPATSTLSALNFMGNLTGNVTGSLVGNATTATTATTATIASSATQVAVNSSTSTAPRYLSFSETTTGNTNLQTNVALNYIPATGTLSAINFTGTTLKGRNFIQLNPTVVASATPTAVNIATDGYISATGSITLPSATDIATAIGGTIGKGTSVEFTVENSSTDDATLVLGTGMSVQTSPTIAGTNSLVVSQANAIGRFRLVFKSDSTAMLFRVY